MKLKLGKLPDTRMVKITLVLPAELKAKIDRYARIHSQTWGQEVSPDAMIPHIIEQFLLHDRAFRKLDREKLSDDLGSAERKVEERQGERGNGERVDR